MKISKNLNLFALRMRGLHNIKMFNVNIELIKVLEDLKQSTNNRINLDFIFDLDFEIKTFEGLVSNEIVTIKLFYNKKNRISLIEINPIMKYTLEETLNSNVFIDHLELMAELGVYDNVLEQMMMNQIKQTH